MTPDWFDSSEQDAMLSYDMRSLGARMNGAWGEDNLILAPADIEFPFRSVGNVWRSDASCVDPAEGNRLVIKSDGGHLVTLFGIGRNSIVVERDTECFGHYTMTRSSTIEIGRHTTINGIRAFAVNGDIVIGDDCMISDEVIIQASSQHGIITASTRELVNKDRQTVRIGRHVWIGRRVLIMPGAEIGEGSIIGAGSVVTGAIEPFSLAAGVPARIVRRDRTWTRDWDGIASVEETGFFDEIATRLPTP